MNLKKMITSVVLAGSALSLVGCDSGGSSSPSTYGAYTPPYATATQFVAGLNSADNAAAYDASAVLLYADETLRSATYGEDQWFVIYDGKYDENKAVSLQYLRSIIYYDYYSNVTGLAEEFRAIERDDILSGDVNGDFWGDDYEVVDYSIFTGIYFGRNSGFAYEDEEESTDVNLMAADAEFKKFALKAAKVSFAFGVSVQSAAKLVNIGSKASAMLNRGDLTLADQKALLGDLESVAGKSLEEIIIASQDPTSKTEMLNEIANNIGTTASKLEGRLLPELFGLKK